MKPYMLWILVAIAIWGLVHSWLASLGVKAAVRSRFGERASGFYRLAYNAFSVLSFIPIILLVGLLPDRVLYVVPAPWRYLMLLGEVLSIASILLAVLQVDAASFIGIRQLVGGEQPAQLVTTGFYRWVRHPLYLFGLLILWFTPSMTRNLFVPYLGLTVYLIIGALFEERKLLREFGPAYAEYKARTPMLIPFLKLPRRIQRSTERTP
jgi:protein-S-isoprenylcysteine O-methyltransferase Ste14